MWKPFWGASDSAQNSNQEMGTPSWYPSPLQYPPPSPSVSSENSSNHSRISDRPQSPSSYGQVSPAEAAGIISVLKNKSVDELKKLLSDKEAYNAVVNSVEQVRDQNKLRNDLLKGTVQLTRDNLDKESQMVEQRNQCAIIQTSELAPAQEKLNELEKQRDYIVSLFAPGVLMNRLRDAMTSADDESEALHQQFLAGAGDLELQSFLAKYKKLRTAYHRRALLHISARTSVS